MEGIQGGSYRLTRILQIMAKGKVDLSKSDAKKEARRLPAPQYRKGDKLPFRVGYVYSALREQKESFSAPNGQMFESVGYKRRTDRVYVRLRRAELGDDNKLGSKPFVRAIALPFRTDQNELIDEGFTSEDILEYLFLMRGYNRKFYVDGISDEDLASEREQQFSQNLAARSEEEERILEERRRRAYEMNPLVKGYQEVEEAASVAGLPGLPPLT